MGKRSENGSTDQGDAGFEQMLEASFRPSRRIGLGDKIDARVISVGSDYVFLDLGGHSEGLLARDEVLDKDGQIAVAEGDRITVFATAFRDGSLICGRRRGGGSDRPDDKQAIFDALKEAFDAAMPLEGTVKESIKGGFSVTVMGERAFCPVSQIDDKYCESPDSHVGKTYMFEILKLGEGGRNVVLSRRRVLEAENEERAAKLWKTIQVGDACEGTVSSIKPYGAFVDLGGIEGLLHVSEISYARVEDPGELLAVGQKLEVSIRAIDTAKRKVSLSLKALLQDPRADSMAALRLNQVLTGRVTRIAQFGAFVEIAPGVEGLVHISEIAPGSRVQTPRKLVSEGQEITVRILGIDLDRKRISLSTNIENAEANWAEELQAHESTSNVKKGLGTFGDLFKDKLTK